MHEGGLRCAQLRTTYSCEVATCGDGIASRIQGLVPFEFGNFQQRWRARLMQGQARTWLDSHAGDVGRLLVARKPDAKRLVLS